MKKIKLYQVDAFTKELFKGNPAAVCVLDQWLDDDLLQSIGNENNLAETAFVVPVGKDFEIRWFTPTVEVDLCGHATLASALILFEIYHISGKEISFLSRRSGILKVTRTEGHYVLDFPTDDLENVDDSVAKEIEDCIGVRPAEVLKGKTDLIAILEDEKVLKELTPNLPGISKLKARGLIVTAESRSVDFVSRFFGPQSGVDEDPVTGSAHTSLIPLWSRRLNKRKLVARQLSKRGGELYCEFRDDRCYIGGEGKLYMTGEIYID